MLLAGTKENYNMADIYSEVAAIIFGGTEEFIRPQQRRDAKRVVYRILYSGMETQDEIATALALPADKLWRILLIVTRRSSKMICEQELKMTDEERKTKISELEEKRWKYKSLISEIEDNIWELSKEDYPPCLFCGVEKQRYDNRALDKRICAPCWNAGKRKD